LPEEFALKTQSDRFRLDHQYANTPSQQVITGAKTILKYLKGTASLGTHIYAHNNEPLKAYADSSFVNEKDIHGRSRWGYCIFWGETLIAHKTTFHECVNLSTTEAEYTALSKTARDALPINRLTTTLTHSDPKSFGLGIAHPQNNKIILYEDNVPAFKATESKRARYTYMRNISTHHFHVNELIQNGLADIRRIPTNIQKADFFTKYSFGKKEFQEKRLNFISPPNPAPSDRPPKN